MMEIVKSVQLAAEGGKATMTAELPKGAAMSMLPMVFLGRVAVDQAIEVEPEAIQEAAEAVPEVVPDAEAAESGRGVPPPRGGRSRAVA